MKRISIILITVITFILSPTLAFAQTATLSLSPASGTFNKGCNFSLNILLNTGGSQTDGTDAILNYDPARFTAVSISNGTIYPEYPGNSIDVPAPGRIVISGLASFTSPFSGQGTLATINFKVKDEAEAAAAQVKFDFNPTDKSNTTDSNVVERGGGDILNSVTDGSYTVGTGNCANTGAGSEDGAGTGASKGGIGTPAGDTDLEKKLPAAGTQEFTAMVGIVGSILVILGALGLALL